jgi:hypothetical protein
MIGGLALMSLAPAACDQLSGTNGPYGGYVGSDAWFGAMRGSAFRTCSNASWRSEIERGLKSGQLSEVLIRINFPGGNPFPKQQLPDLQVVGPKGDIGAWPYAKDKTSACAHYYLILTKGVPYTLRWSYYFGQKEEIARIIVKPGGAGRCHATIDYTAPRSGEERNAARTDDGRVSPPQGYQGPVSDGDFKRSVSDGGYKSPVSDGDFKRPVSDGDFKRPVSDGDYKSPRSDGDYKSPASDGDFKRPAVQRDNHGTPLKSPKVDPADRCNKPGTGKHDVAGDKEKRADGNHNAVKPLPKGNNQYIRPTSDNDFKKPGTQK